jgi:drug/metabolite transporter (DMT)-like permease
MTKGRILVSSLAGYHLMALLTVSIWGLTFVSTKVLLEQGLAPATIFFIRTGIAYLAIWPFARKPFVTSWKDEMTFLLLGMTGGSLYFLAENTALAYTLASNVSLIICTAPILTTLLYKAIHRSEKIPLHFIAGSLLAFLGVWLVVENGNSLLHINPLGDMLALLAAFMWACYSLLLKPLTSRYNPFFITRKVFFYGLLTILPWFIYEPITVPTAVLLKPIVFWNLLFLGLIASLLCFVLWSLAAKRLKIVRLNLYIYFSPAVTLVASGLFLGEPITRMALIGAALIMGGVSLAEINHTQ